MSTDVEVLMSSDSSVACLIGIQTSLGFFSILKICITVAALFITVYVLGDVNHYFYSYPEVSRYQHPFYANVVFDLVRSDTQRMHHIR